MKVFGKYAALVMLLSVCVVANATSYYDRWGGINGTLQVGATIQFVITGPSGALVGGGHGYQIYANGAFVCDTGIQTTPIYQCSGQINNPGANVITAQLQTTRPGMCAAQGGSGWVPCDPTVAPGPITLNIRG